MLCYTRTRVRERNVNNVNVINVNKKKKLEEMPRIDKELELVGRYEPVVDEQEGYKLEK